MELTSVAWVAPKSVAPQHFVNRSRDVRRLLGILEDLCSAGTAGAKILVTGDRGVGKSIFTRHVIDRFGQDHPEVLTLVTDARGITYPTFLQSLARELVKVALEKLLQADVTTGQRLERALRELGLLASSNGQIKRGQVSSLTDARGASLGMSGGILAGLEANGLYTWTRTSVDSAISETTLQITDALLHAAITEVLQKLQHVGWKVVVFYDDLDQASGTSDPDRAKEIIQKVLALSGCIALIHLRTEVMFDDVRREIDETLHLEPLSPTQLRDILAGRLQNAPVAAKTAFDQNNLGETLDRLAQQSLTPLVYLQTLHALLREHEQLPLPPDWHQPLPLARAIRRAISAGLEPQQLLDLAEVVDQNTTDRWFKLAYLESGNPVIHTTTKKIGKEALEQAKRLGLIYARDRYRSDSDYAMEPTLELLRPSRRAKLATA